MEERKNLSEEKGPLSEAPFPPKNAPRDGGRWKKWKKNCSLYFLKIDFSLTLRGGLTGRQVGVSDWRRERIEGGRQVVSNTKADKRSLLAEYRVWWRHTLEARTQSHTHTSCNKHKPALAKKPHHCFMHVSNPAYSAALRADLFHQIVARKMWF